MMHLNGKSADAKSILNTLWTGFLLLMMQGPAQANNVFDHSSSPLKVKFEAHPPAPPDSITLGAYYYPWWYRHFGAGKEGWVRDELDPRQEVRLGKYDDREVSVIQQHLEWSRQANIGVWICSWWGEDSGEDLTLKNTILNSDKIDLGDHKIALLYETMGRIIRKSDEVYDYSNFESDFEYICNTPGYFDNENYYKINGKPVVVIYLTRWLDNSKIEILDDVIPLIRKTCKDNIYIIGDQVWSNPSGDTLNLLDAITNYDIYGNMGRPRYAGQAKVDEYFKQAADWKAADEIHNASFVPSVSPGFNDRGVRLEVNHAAMSRRLDETSEEGSLLAAQLVQAISLLDPTADNLLLVNSFNEWHEDTQIEPVDGKTTTLPDEYTQGLEYSGYGTLYLDILSTYTLKVDADVEPFTSTLPIEYTGQVYSNSISLAAYYWSWSNDFDQGLRANLNSAQRSTFSEADDPILGDLHLAWQANIRTWVLPWTGPSPHVTDIGAAALFNHDDLIKSGHELAIHYNVRSRSDGEETRGGAMDLTLVKTDIEYLCDEYLTHPNYRRTPGIEKPILFLGLTRVYSDLHLGELVEAIRSSCPNKDLYLVGDEIWGNIQPAPYLPFSKLDAVMNHDVYGNMEEPEGYSGQAALDDYYEQQRQWRIAAWQEGCSFVPTVMPGYNDRAVRSAKNNPALARALEQGQAEGSFFAESLNKAKHLLDPDMQNLILVHSFNHFAEDSQIYPICGVATDKPISFTQGLLYEAYENTYLDLLKGVSPDGSYTDSVFPYQRYECPSDASSPSPVQSNAPSRAPTNFPSLSPSNAPSDNPSKLDAEDDTWTEIMSDGFENWITFRGRQRGDAILDSAQKETGESSLRLRDDSRGANARTKLSYKVNAYQQLRVTFSFYTEGVEPDERFLVEYKQRRGDWTIGKEYTCCSEDTFENGGSWKAGSATWDNDGSAGRVRIRFRAAFANNNHKVWIDNVVFEGKE